MGQESVMSEQSPAKAMSLTNVTASFTTLIIGIATLIPADLVSAEAKVVLPIMAGLISPYLAALAIRLFQKVNLDPDLVVFMSRLKSDLERQNALLKNTTDMSDDTRAMLIQKRDATLLRLASAHQDYSDGSVSISRAPLE